jgi:hypothetical protein
MSGVQTGTSFSTYPPLGMAMQTVGAEPCGLCGTFPKLDVFFIIVDEHSKWPEVIRMHETTSYKTIEDETGKTEVPCQSRCGTIKIPPCSKALSVEHRPKFLALHRQW